ncbi:MAG: hypothetical protein V5A13_06585 [Haloarculaceae archaeon]
MRQTLAEDIDAMLTSVQEQVDDSELTFKLRTARQLVVVYDELLREHGESLHEEDVDPEALENLRQLGYVE